MPSFVYILYSTEGDTFYIGETEDIVSRIAEHNTYIYSGSHTMRYNDWVLYLLIECRNRIQARKVEQHIKKMKSRKYIKDLQKYPSIIEKLILKYN
ncbi:MAG: GIY-YIG nuclease family protein [Saprospiraceae bacterium]